MPYFLAISSLIIIISSLSYHFFSLNLEGVVFSLLSAIIVLVLLVKKGLLNNINNNLKPKINCFKLFFLKIDSVKDSFNTFLKDHLTKTAIWKKNSFWLTVAYILFYLLALIILIFARNNEALISPWQKVSPWFFVVYFLATIVLFLLSRQNKKWLLIPISLHYALTLSVATIVYGIGYGFDPFIHQASLEYIDKYGFINPKTFYYIGQYGLLITIHKLTFIPLAILNTWLVPVLSALTLPWGIKKISDYWGIKSYLIPLLILILPFSFFISTTPQNLSFLFLLLTTIALINIRDIKNLVLPSLLAGATFFIHPLAGLPALILVIITLSLLVIKKKPWLYLVIGGLFILNILIIPLALLISGGGHLINFPWSTFFSTLSLNLHFPNQENVILNSVYFLSQNYYWLLIILYLMGIFWFIKNKIFNLLPHLLIILSLLISYLFSQCLKFQNLIAYEQNDYQERILYASLLIGLPFIIIVFQKIIEKVINSSREIKIIGLISGSLLLSSSLYLSYPRLDNYYNSRGYSVGASDLKAVQWIEQDNNSSLIKWADLIDSNQSDWSRKNNQEKYVVLANQQVSVAALHIFGFERYLNTKEDPIYFYPIPTGGKLYQHYLKMVYEKPEAKTMKEIMAWLKVKNAYLVINKYWWASDKIIEEAKLEAQSWQNIDNGTVWVFKY
ncbi:MAG: hypothetical protein MUF50_01390 [Planctomycetes bacterium]|jgi:hypothetical protein|nr:hypothetical protein [Planctomycetota bacterium]